MKLLLALWLMNAAVASHIRGERDTSWRNLDEAAPNNLAVPLLLADSSWDGGTIEGPTMSVASFSFSETCVLKECDADGVIMDENTQCLVDEGESYYLQRTSGNTWGNWLIPSDESFVVDLIDVGDRLQVTDAMKASMVRVETTLYQGGLNNGDEGTYEDGKFPEPYNGGLMAIEMAGPFCNTEGIDEVHGTTKKWVSMEDSRLPQACDGQCDAIVVFGAGCPKYHFQYIGEECPQVETGLLFNEQTRKWEGDNAGDGLFSVTATSEVTVSGGVTYGCNLRTSELYDNTGSSGGCYRETFYVSDCTQAMIRAEETKIYMGAEERKRKLDEGPAFDYGHVITANMYKGGNYPEKGGGIFKDLSIKTSAAGGSGGGGDNGNKGGGDTPDKNKGKKKGVSVAADTDTSGTKDVKRRKKNPKGRRRGIRH